MLFCLHTGNSQWSTASKYKVPLSAELRGKVSSVLSLFQGPKQGRNENFEMLAPGQTHWFSSQVTEDTLLTLQDYIIGYKSQF